MQLRYLDTVLPEGGHGSINVEGGKAQTPEKSGTKTLKKENRHISEMDLEGHRLVAWGGKGKQVPVH